MSPLNRREFLLQSGGALVAGSTATAALQSIAPARSGQRHPQAVFGGQRRSFGHPGVYLAGEFKAGTGKWQTGGRIAGFKGGVEFCHRLSPCRRHRNS